MKLGVSGGFMAFSVHNTFGLLNKHYLHLCHLSSLLNEEYNQSFTLSINRNHRGFRRVVTSKGLKLELLHKG